jgi:hypothetical protein
MMPKVFLLEVTTVIIKCCCNIYYICTSIAAAAQSITVAVIKTSLFVSFSIDGSTDYMG